MHEEIDERVIEELQTLFDFVPRRQFSRKIVQMYFLHISSNQGVFPVNFHELTRNVYFLLKFLEIAEEHIMLNEKSA
jgi:hypothetical protein